MLRIPSGPEVLFKPYLKAGYMDAFFFLSNNEFFLAIRSEPYMTLICKNLCTFLQYPFLLKQHNFYRISWHPSIIPDILFQNKKTNVKLI